MDKPATPDRLAARVIFGLILIHLSFCLYLILFPGHNLLGNRPLTSFYRIHLLPGPFFKDDLIVATPHLQMSYKSGSGPWSRWLEPEHDNFVAYQKSKWKYHKLKQSTFERFLARNLGRKITDEGESGYAQFNEFKNLNRYFADLYLPPEADSVALVYRLTRYDAGSGLTRSDTLFHVKYRLF